MSLLLKYIRELLKESYDDVVELAVKVRVSVSKPAGPNMMDIMTDVRGLKNVITARQYGPRIPAPEGREWVRIIIGFEDDETYDVSDLERGILSAGGVDAVIVKSYGGEPYASNESLVREYIQRVLLSEITKLPEEYFSGIDKALRQSEFWKEPNSQDDIDLLGANVMGTPAAEALQIALQEVFKKLNLDMDVLIRSHDTDDLERMSLHPDHPAWPNKWLIDANWYVSKLRPGRNTIDLEMMTSESGVTDLDPSALVRHIAQTVRHELVHWSQMKKQAVSKGGLSDTDAFEEMLQDPKQIVSQDDPKYYDVYEPTGELDGDGNEIIRKEGFNHDMWAADYLRSHIEIDAHAHDAAEELLAAYGLEGAYDIIRGKVNLNDPKLPNALAHYYKILPSNDNTLYKLRSKIYSYIQHFTKGGKAS